MKLIIYGTKTCKDCVDALEVLEQKNVRYLFLEFSDSIGNLTYTKLYCGAVRN